MEHCNHHHHHHHHNMMERRLKKCCYVQPPVRESMKPQYKYKPSGIPFEDETVHRTSYMPIDAETAASCKPESMKPKQNLDLNKDLRMDTNTVHDLSYQPVKTKPRVTPPWAVKEKFTKPNIPMDLNTIYENSYQLPGTFKECDENAKNDEIVAWAENCDDIDGLVRIPDGPRY